MGFTCGTSSHLGNSGTQCKTLKTAGVLAEFLIALRGRKATRWIGIASDM